MASKEKLLGAAELCGETMVLAGSAGWLFAKDVASVVFALGVAVFAIGRFAQRPAYTRYSHADPRELTLRRLHNQRVFACVLLIVAAVLMHMPVGFYGGVWLGGMSWLLFFVMFVGIELYTAFRISAVDKDK